MKNGEWTVDSTKPVNQAGNHSILLRDNMLESISQYENLVPVRKFFNEYSKKLA